MKVVSVASGRRIHREAQHPRQLGEMRLKESSDYINQAPDAGGGADSHCADAASRGGVRQRDQPGRNYNQSCGGRQTRGMQQ